MNATLFARLGAVCYVIWGLLHLSAAGNVFSIGFAMTPSEVQGRVLQDAWYIGTFAITAIAIGATLNWRNNRWGYWISLAVVSTADIPFILFLLLPGLLPLWPAILGPIFWVAGAVFSTLGRVSARRVAPAI